MRKTKKIASDEQFLELYNKGYNDYDIAKKLGVSRSQIWYKRRRHKLMPNGKSRNAAENP
jgi:uncharacterized protein YjcR